MFRAPDLYTRNGVNCRSHFIATAGAPTATATAADPRHRHRSPPSSAADLCHRRNSLLSSPIPAQDSFPAAKHTLVFHLRHPPPLPSLPPTIGRSIGPIVLISTAGIILIEEMSLKESLNKFKRQQENCQSTLTSIAAQTSSSKPHRTHKAVSTLQVGSKATTQVKFSNDTERLQHINAIRKSPVGAQIKRVINLLYETREGFTPEQINEAIYVDINGNKAVFDSLRNNHKVHYDGKRFWYKSKHDLSGKDGLLSLIRKFPEGLAVVDVRDSYPTVMDDLQALKTAGQVWLLSNMDSQEDIVYPNDPKIVIKVDDDLKLLFRSIELPRDMVDIEKDLQKNGMKPATNTVQRRAKAQVHGAPNKPKPKKKKHEISKRTKLTNAHLPELFQMK